MNKGRPTGRPIFVPYAPLDRAAWWLAGLAALGFGLAALVLALFLAPSALPAVPGVQPEAGASFRGFFRKTPYPHLVVQAQDGEIGTLLLVGHGKGGIGPSDVPDGPCVATGRLLQRGRTRLLSDVVVRPLDEPLPFSAPPWVVPVEPIELRGEIIDPKCAFGRMLPGLGAAHRACAQMCIQGGVPPLLLVSGSSERHLLILDRAGQPAVASVLPFVGEPVQLTGYRSNYAGLEVLFLESPSAIVRP